MNIGNKYLRSWLRFDESATKDFIADNQWQIYGNPTISETNALNGKALQLDGSTYLKLSDIELGGRDFTIDCFAYINSTSPSNARLFSLINSSNSNYFITVRKSSSNSNRVNVWANSYADYSQNSGGNVDNTQTATNKRVHIAIVYKHTSSSPSYLYLCVDGYVQRLNPNMTMPPPYNRGTFNLVLGAQPDGTQGLIGAVDEFRIYDGANYWTSGSNFTPPDAAFYNNIEFYPDVIRLAKTPASEWRYENIGEISTLINTQTAAQLDNLPTTQSRTGKAFYQTTQAKIFDVASSKEVWIKFDVYFDGVNRWRAYDISAGSTGITAQTDGRISFFNRNTSKRDFPEANEAKINALQTIILHMIADSSNGLIEAYTDDGGLLYVYTGEVNNGTNFSNLYLQSDGAGTFFSNVVISNSPLWFDDNAAITFLLDAIRMPHIPASEWRYENAGDTSDLNTTTAVQLDNLPATQSTTGKAFYQTTDGIKLFDINTVSEIWIKFDVYGTDATWKVFNDVSYGTGIMHIPQEFGTGATRIRVMDGTSQDVDIETPEFYGNLRTVILHMIADSTNGLIEVFSDAHGLLYEHTGNVNNGNSFSSINMLTGFNPEDAFFSNVIISNNPLWFDDNVSRNKVNFLVDAQRNISRSLALLFDTERIVTESAIAVNLSADAQREIVVSTTDMLDAERRLSKDFVLDLDTERIITGVVVQVSLLLDTERKVANVVTVHFDKEWGYFCGAELLLDTEREIGILVNFTADVLRKIPHVVTDIPAPQPPPPEPTPGVVPPAQNDAFLQSASISISEQQLTDNITFTATGNFGIMDDVNYQILDYVLTAKIEETTTKGVLTTCKCTADIDALLYQQLAYSVPESEWEYTDEYKEYVHSKGGSIRTDPDYDEAELKAIPSAPASAHITEIAAKLGKNVSLHFTDFISTMSTDVKSGTNYAGLLQELFGWTSRIPILMINCYIRGNTIYVVQRGQEQNVVNLDGQKLTVHTVNKKVVRTTWGSDTWSKTEVKPYFNDWIEGVNEPLPDEGGEGGTEYNEEGLVEETTVQHGDETVVTHYYYETLDNGQKFLYREVATTYNNGSVVDEVTTIHDPVRDSQSHVYSVDADGVLGGVVTSSNNDDRRTPWQNAKSSFAGGIVVSGIDGNQYLLKELIYHSDKGEMATRTINGVSLIDTSFPVEGEDMLQFLTDYIVWLNRKTEETVTVDVYDYPHIIDFNDRVVFGGNRYYLRSNIFTMSAKIINRQSLELVRWY